MNRKLEHLVLAPAVPAADRLERTPVAIVRAERLLVPAEDPDLQILVLACDLTCV